jgi:hypothetical protein
MKVRNPKHFLKRMSVELLINFETFTSTNGIFLNIHYFPLQYFLIRKQIILENFSISENNIISVELAKVLVR